MMDANFKLKSKKRASKDDVELGPGWSYFVEDKEYTEHLRMNENEKEVCPVVLIIGSVER